MLSPQLFVPRAIYVIMSNPHHAAMKCWSCCRTGSKCNDYSQPSTLLSPASLVNSHTLCVVIGILLCIAEQQLISAVEFVSNKQQTGTEIKNCQT